MKKTAVLGNVCIDEIHTFEGEFIEGLGGAFHNHLILSLLFKGKGIISPVCKVGYDLYDDLIRKYNTLKNIDTGNIIKVNGKNNRVKLTYISENDRREYSVSNPPEIVIDEISKDTKWDLFIINLISGIEISRKTFDALYDTIKAPFLVDLHSLFLGFRKDGLRYYREDEDWNTWFHTGDIMQMNEKEAEVLSGRKLKSENDLIDFGIYLLNFGAEVVLITTGEKGSIVCFREHEKFTWEKIPAYTYYNNVYPTGCGDAYSSGFAYRYVYSSDPVESAHFASKIAGLKAGIKKPGDMVKNFYDLLDKFKIGL